MKIVEVDRKVIIDDFAFDGYIEKGKSCSQCQSDIIYYDAFDTYFCPGCNHWLESKCNDPHCYYCPNRPEKPLNSVK